MTLKCTQAAELDASFGENGRQVVQTPGNFTNNLSTVAIDPQGRLTLIGSYQRVSPVANRPGVGRLLDSGDFDIAFGAYKDGLTVAPENVEAATASGLAWMPDGSFYITGPAFNQLPLVHYDRDGTLIEYLSLVDSPTATSQLLAMSDTVMVATSNPEGGIVYRYPEQPDGPDFGTDGKATFLTGSSYVSTLHMARNIDSSLFYLAGEVANDGYIVRMDLSGNLDPGFANAGVYRIKMLDARYSACRRVIALADGKILALVNGSGSDADPACHVIRLTETGRVDATFNRGEPVRVGEVGEDMSLQADGKFLVAHRSPQTGNHVTRYLPTGSADTSFGDNGTGVFTTSSDQISFVKGVVAQPDGKIVIAGTFGSTTALLRLLA